VLLLRDVVRDVWIYFSAIDRGTAAREGALLTAWTEVRKWTGNAPEVLLLGTLTELAKSDLLRHHAMSLFPFPEGEERYASVVEEFFERCGLSSGVPGKNIGRLTASSATALKFFSCATGAPEDELALDLLAALMGRAAMKSFARRLMGFQSATAEHLYRNFLEGISTVRLGDKRIEVELPRTPLSVVLELAGITKQRTTIPWLGGREVCLLPPRG
jgi:hypothetical protein